MSMSILVRISGVEEVAKKFMQMAETNPQLLESACRDSMELIRSSAIELTSFYHIWGAVEHERRTRRVLENPGCIQKIDDLTYQLLVDPTDEKGRQYAGFIEFGTSRQYPRPFMQEALAHSSPNIELILATALKMAFGRG